MAQGFALLYRPRKELWRKVLHAFCRHEEWTVEEKPEGKRTGVGISASDIVPHLNRFGKFPMLSSFTFGNVDLRPGDILYVPSFWWHQVESLPCKASGYTIVYN
jgi:hypothetical protein